MDALLRLTAKSGATRTYGVEAKRRMTAELATAVHFPSTLPPLLFTTYLGEPVAERLRARGIDYVDAAGNAHLSWDDVLIDVRGRRKPAMSAGRASPRGAGAFGRAGLLSNAGYLYERGNERRLARGAELLDRWSEAYSITLVSALTLYVDRLPTQLIGRHRLARADSDGNVHVRTRFWQAPAPESWLVPSPLIYADLLASGEPRQREHGDRIRRGDDRLKRIDRT